MGPPQEASVKVVYGTTLMAQQVVECDAPRNYFGDLSLSLSEFEMNE